MDSGRKENEKEKTSNETSFFTGEEAGGAEEKSILGRRDFMASMGKYIGMTGIGLAGISSISRSELDEVLAGLGWGSGRGGRGIFGILGGKKEIPVKPELPEISPPEGACPPQCQFFHGGNCTGGSEFRCPPAGVTNQGFVCQGGKRDDFECAEPDGFNCTEYFACHYSFDASDCMYKNMDVFTCNKAGRLKGYWDEDEGGPYGSPNCGKEAKR